jgi:putative acetyltransferase
VACPFDIRVDDLSGDEIRALIRLHLEGMHANSPPEKVCALGLEKLRSSDITVWSAWRDGRLAGMGALKDLGGKSGELKSMRTHPDFLRQGVAAALLEHIIGVARERGLTRISLETGTGPAFDPAIALYRRYGFDFGKAFADYEENAFSQFLHLALV